MSLQNISSVFSYLHPIDLVDIGLLALVIYWLLTLIQGTRAFPILIGCALLLGAYTMAGIFELNAINWLLENVFGFAVVIMTVLFQEDIRNALARVGLTTLRRDVREGTQTTEDIIKEVLQAAQTLCGLKIGASLVFERETGLRDYIENGRPLNADCRAELLQAIFHPSSPLHDGAVIINQQGKLAAARCILPLAAFRVNKNWGTRHRSALGLSGITDSVVVVISEEQRSISLACDNKLYPNLDSNQLQKKLLDLLVKQPSKKPFISSISNAIPRPVVQKTP